MNVGLISVGTEIIIGDILNTNVYYLSQELAKIGINVYLHAAIGDNESRLTNIIDSSFQIVDTLIITGGLGPTKDDITKEVAAKYLKIDLEFSNIIWDRIKEYGRKYSKNTEATKNNMKQAMIPKNSIILNNIIGTAPGAIMEKDGKRIILLPGPPLEMKSMYENELKPYLKQFSNGKIISRYIRIYGIGESALEVKLKELLENQADVTIALYAKNGEVLIRVTTLNKGIEDVEKVVNKIKEKCGEYIYLIGDEEISNSQSELPRIVSELIKKEINSLKIIESGTFGLFTHTLTRYKEVADILKESKIVLNNEDNIKKLLENMNEDLNILILSDTKIHNNKLIDDIKGIVGIKFRNKEYYHKFHFKGTKERVEIRIVLETLNELLKILSNLKNERN